MNIYFAGIGGVGLGPLALVAHDLGYQVVGSDMAQSLTTDELARRGITLQIGPQSGEFLREQHAKLPFDYLVYTAALPADHAELVAARQLGISCLKRDGLLARIIDETGLDMIACAGTHGKTSTTGLFVWVCKQLGVPLSYLVGSTLSFGPSGSSQPDSRFLVYECDEYDRNFLHFTPELSILSSVDYDHPDTYPTLSSYQEAFVAFMEQSRYNLLWEKDFEALGSPAISSDYQIYDSAVSLEHIHLPGLHMRQNAFLVERAIMRLLPDTGYHDLISAINSFPGTDRRMERLAENLYSDYGHHPAEIAATLQLVRELNEHVVLVYQPHQNTRQHMIRDQYSDKFESADVIYWLPTYLSREDPTLPILSPAELGSSLTNSSSVEVAELDDELWEKINQHRESGHLVLCMGAGDIDDWVRKKLASDEQ